MQSVQRQFTKLRSKGPGNNAAVSVLLKEYEDADQLLARVSSTLPLSSTSRRPSVPLLTGFLDTAP